MSIPIVEEHSKVLDLPYRRPKNDPLPFKLPKRQSPLYALLMIVGIIIIVVVTGSVAFVAGAVMVLLILFYPIILILWDRLYGVEDIADQVFRAQTDDGWTLVMHFHRPQYPRPGAFPVILCHGIANNKYGVDMDRAHSLAYYLKQNGYPVFVVNLRGVGKSRFASRDGLHDFSFDDIVEYDIPAIIKRVKELTGAPKINWVGHSMGGMIMYGYLGRKLRGYEDVVSFVALGSPARVDHVTASMMSLVTDYPWISKILDLRFGAQIISPLSGRFLAPIEQMLYSPQVVSRTTFRKLMKNGVENIAPGLTNQFVNWIKSGRMYTLDGSFNYHEGLRNIKVPTLFVSGGKDMIAIPSSVKFAYDNVRSRKKKYLMISKENGASADYCHTGLVLGERANQEVFPEVLGWLDQYGCERRFRFPFMGIVQRLKRRKLWRMRKGKRQYRSSILPGDVISG